MCRCVEPQPSRPEPSDLERGVERPPTPIDFAVRTHEPQVRESGCARLLGGRGDNSLFVAFGRVLFCAHGHLGPTAPPSNALDIRPRLSRSAFSRTLGFRRTLSPGGVLPW